VGPVKVAVVVLAISVVTVGCSSGRPATRLSLTPLSPASTSGESTTPAPPHVSPRPTPTTAKTAVTPSSAGGDAHRTLRAMTEPQRVGQLFMVGASSNGPTGDTMSAITSYHTGSVILTDTSRGSIDSIAAVSRQLQQASPDMAGLFIATDQEGGEVQRLQGPGFEPIPGAAEQASIPPARLRADARRWGGQLRAGGVNVNLAPVLDTVPSAAAARSNPPIGALSRQYGYTPATVTGHGLAFAQGMADADVDATVKHFPGLGRVTGNTDTTAGVTDSTTTRHDAYLAPFAAAVRAGMPFVMVSTAYYSRIDPDHPAAFSPTIVTGMLRGDLGFRGVVVSDDVGAADQVAALSPGARAVAFVAAGGDLVLTVDPAQIPEMTAAVLAKARADATFRAEVDAAALRVLAAKQARGLLRR
jgi:beta-N-acetylhexosaminidase